MKHTIAALLLTTMLATAQTTPRNAKRHAYKYTCAELREQLSEGSKLISITEEQLTEHYSDNPQEEAEYHTALVEDLASLRTTQRENRREYKACPAQPPN
jgi:hypothetical protein